MTADENTAVGVLGFLFFFAMHVRGQEHQHRQLQRYEHPGFLLLLLRIGGSGVWQSQAWMCHEFRGLPRLRCPCSRPPRPTRSPETTPGWMSPAPPVPAGSECPF